MPIRNKGTKLYTAVNDYIIFDLETTKRFVSANCKIIEISALKIRNDEIVDIFSTLVNPKGHIPSSATEINNITDIMVMDAPEITEVFPKFLDFIGDDVLIGHNIDTFDLNLIIDISINLYNKPITNFYIDTYHLSKRVLPELSNHRLETLSKHLGIGIDKMHRAENDCMITHKLYMHLKPLLKEQISPCFSEHKPNKKAQYNYAKIKNDFVNNNFFLGKTCIVYGTFRQLSLNQIQQLFKVVGAIYVDFFCYSANYLILGEDMYNKYISGVVDDLINSAVTQRIPVISEFDFIRLSGTEFLPERNATDFDTNFDVSGKTICLTGDFDIAERELIINRLVELGAIVKTGIIKSLDYLIVGGRGSQNYKNGQSGSKQEKVEYYNSIGGNILIISESDFFKDVCVNV